MGIEATSVSLIIADAHVHIYSSYDITRFLSRAGDNFASAIRNESEISSFTPVLFLTEGRSADSFHRLSRRQDLEPGSDSHNGEIWNMEHTEEQCSLIARSSFDRKLYIIAGRQIITAEKLEVLALGSYKSFEDGKTLAEIVESVTASGAIPVIPWGFGKWYGKRGVILKNFLENSSHDGLYLGDNGGRPGFLPYPRHFTLANRRNMRILPGSDPLPFESESWRAGSFGFTLNGSISSSYPARDMKDMLLDGNTVIKPYGKLEQPFRFIRNQTRMQLLKLRSKKMAE